MHCSYRARLYGVQAETESVRSIVCLFGHYRKAKGHNEENGAVAQTEVKTVTKQPESIKLYSSQNKSPMFFYSRSIRLFLFWSFISRTEGLIDFTQPQAPRCHGSSGWEFFPVECLYTPPSGPAPLSLLHAVWTLQWSTHTHTRNHRDLQPHTIFFLLNTNILNEEHNDTITRPIHKAAILHTMLALLDLIQGLRFDLRIRDKKCYIKWVCHVQKRVCLVKWVCHGEKKCIQKQNHDQPFSHWAFSPRISSPGAFRPTPAAEETEIMRGKNTS